MREETQPLPEVAEGRLQPFAQPDPAPAQGTEHKHRQAAQILGVSPRQLSAPARNLETKESYKTDLLGLTIGQVAKRQMSP